VSSNLITRSKFYFHAWRRLKEGLFWKRFIAGPSLSMKTGSRSGRIRFIAEGDRLCRRQTGPPKALAVLLLLHPSDRGRADDGWPFWGTIVTAMVPADWQPKIPVSTVKPCSIRVRDTLLVTG
jgi:hypothetical protein